MWTSRRKPTPTRRPALIDLAETLHTSPAELRERAPSGAEPRSVALPGLDPYARATACTSDSARRSAISSDRRRTHPGPLQRPLSPGLPRVSSYGATIHRPGTRLAGTVIGLFRSDRRDDRGDAEHLRAARARARAVAGHGAIRVRRARGPRFSYVGLQIVVAFAIVALAEQRSDPTRTSSRRCGEPMGPSSAPRHSFSRSASSARLCGPPARRPLYRRRA